MLLVGLGTAKGQPALTDVRSRAKREMPQRRGGKEGGGLRSLGTQSMKSGPLRGKVKMYSSAKCIGRKCTFRHSVFNSYKNKSDFCFFPAFLSFFHPSNCFRPTLCTTLVPEGDLRNYFCLHIHKYKMAN